MGSTLQADSSSKGLPNILLKSWCTRPPLEQGKNKEGIAEVEGIAVGGNLD